MKTQGRAIFYDQYTGDIIWDFSVKNIEVEEAVEEERIVRKFDTEREVTMTIDQSQDIED